MPLITVETGLELLRRPAEPVLVFGAALRELVEEMLRVCTTHKGAGLAANQVGDPRAVILIFPPQQGPRVLVNPSEPKFEGGRALSEETCLSVPGKVVRLKRYIRVSLTAQDLSGAEVQVAVSGLSAVVLQHELDHLAGRLITDADPRARKDRCRDAVHAAPGVRLEEGIIDGPVVVGAITPPVGDRRRGRR